MRTVVVGVDGSPASLDALRWAQGIAGDASVRAVTSWAYPVEVSSMSMEGSVMPLTPLDVWEERARRIIDDACAMVPAAGVERTAEVVLGMTEAGGLLDVAESGDLLVIGIRPHSRLERALGTLAVQCAQHAPCPFVAVPESAPAVGDLIAVAFDGSGPSRAALGWAGETAGRLGLRLRVIAAWERTHAPGGLRLQDDPVAPDDRAIEGLRSAVDDAVPGLAERVELCPVHSSGGVAASLVAAAEGTGALVMGSRGRGGFRGLMLGSVSQRCLESSPVPVVIIRD